MMFRSTVFLLTVCFFFTLTLQDEIYQPRPDQCLRKRGELWWEHHDVNFENKCELDPTTGEECGVCGRPCYTCYRRTTIYPACWHKGMGWKFDIIKPEGSNVQLCLTMDHCKLSYLMKDESQLRKVCGDGNGTEEKRGKCKSVYGTYVCECKKPYQGRDCNDLGPEGAYATGVQVLLDTMVRVSNMMTILVAVKSEGHDFKVHVNMLQYDTLITITKPTIHDSSSNKLIKLCQRNTNLKDQCATYLEGSTSIYSVALRFPLRRDFSVWYYEDKETKINHTVGYNTTFTITTTNTVDGLEKESFFRSQYDRSYIVFVEYPMDIGCYENVQIVNCKEVQEIVKTYDASNEILLTGNIPKVDFIEPATQMECKTEEGDTMKWILWKIMPDGVFHQIDELNVENDINFVIKPYTLKNGMYRVEFIYKMSTKWDTRENFDQCFFTVVEAPLIAIIEGGNGRYVDVDTEVVLDASGSYDPNLAKDNNKAGLNFEWSCVLNETGQACLEEYIGPSRGSGSSTITLPPSIMISRKEYTIKLIVTKEGKEPAYASQTLFTGSKGKILSIGMQCVNCMEGNIANPTEYIYLLVKVVLKEPENIDSPLNYTWTFSNYPDYPPSITAEAYRVNETSEFLLKVDRKKLKENKTYSFRAAVEGDAFVFSEINIHIPAISNFTCSLAPDSGTVAVTDYSLNCSTPPGLTIEVYDKSSSDPNYFTGRMMFTDLNSTTSFKLANKKLVVYGYNKYKMIQEWVHEHNIQSFQGHLNDIDGMVIKLDSIKMYPQKLLHSASVIPGSLTSDMDWSSVSLLKRLISSIYQVNYKASQHTKLMLSTIEFILVLLSKINSKIEFNLEVEEAKMCADIISALASNLFEKVKTFGSQETITETILNQMIYSHLNVIEIVLSVKNAEVLSKPLYLVNPRTLHTVRDTTCALVDAFYKLSSCLLWRQIEGDSATEIVSTGSNLSEWAFAHHPEKLYHLRRHNQSIPFNFSFGFYQIMKNLDVLGFQVTTLRVNPFWWAGGDINTNILLVDICFKVNPTQCKYQRTFYKAPIYLYFNISQLYKSIKPLEIHTVSLNLTKDPQDLDLEITVYRFDPPMRAKLFIEFEFENNTEDYKVLININERPDFDMMNKRGLTINNENQSFISLKYLNYVKDDSDKLYYIGIFPIQRESAAIKKKFKLKIVYAVCKTWLRWKWGNQRCWVGEQETDERTLRCDCNHLSMFAGAVQVPLYTLNPALEFLLFLTEEFNWLPLIVLIIVILTFIILYFWGCCKDKKDSRKGLVTVLEDNYPGDSFAYLIGVYTGSRINSGTDANVAIKLFGDSGKSRVHLLKNSNRRTLRGNSDDWFLLYSPAHLGTLNELYVWHDNSGKSPDWFIENFEVYDLTDKIKYIFELNIWLALDVNEYPEALVATSSLEDYYSVRRVFLSNVVTGFRDTHYWTSIFWKHPRNPVKRVQRISVIMSYVMVAMACCVIFYHLNKGEEYKEDEPSYSVNYVDFIIFTITSLVASFISCLVMFLFRKSYSNRYSKNMESSLFLRPAGMSKRSSFSSSKRNEFRSQTNSSKNLATLSLVSLYDSTKPRRTELSYISRDESFIRSGPRSKPPVERSTYENFVAAVHAIVQGSNLNPIIMPKYKSSAILLKRYCLLAWLLFITIVLVAIAVLILFGHRIPQVESKKWLTILLCALLFDALVFSTLKVLLCSAILGCVFQRVVPEAYHQIRAEDGVNKKLFGDSKYLFKLSQTRSKPMYFPLNDNLKALYTQKSIRRRHWRTLIDFLVVILLILILIMLNVVYTVNYFTSNTHALRMLTQGPLFKYQNYTNIYNRTLYSEFLIYNFIDQLHRYLWYTQEDPLNDNDFMRRRSWTYDCTMRLLGNVRIRQLRVILGDCPPVKYFEDMAEYCSPPWSLYVEDTGTYSSRWYAGRKNTPLRRQGTAWRYTSPMHSNSSVSYGVTLTLYPSGGFIEDLGFKKDDNEDALASLIPQNWLDHMTRAVFVELTLYNVNTRLFTQVVLVAEQMPTGQYLLAAKAHSVTTNFNFDVWKLGFGVFFIFFFVRTCVLINQRGLFIHLSKIINIYEMFLLALGLFAFSFYFVHIKTSSDYVREFQRRGFDEFFNFFTIVSYSNLSRTALCVLFVCLIVRMFISARFGRMYFTFFYTLYLSMPWLVWMVVYFVMYLVAVQRLISYLLNLFIFPYRTTVILYTRDFPVSECEDLSYKVLVYVVRLSTYVVILFFTASFAYYYKVAKVYKLIDTDKLNFFVFIKEIICKRRKNKK